MFAVIVPEKGRHVSRLDLKAGFFPRLRAERLRRARRVGRGSPQSSVPFTWARRPPRGQVPTAKARS